MSCKWLDSQLSHTKPSANLLAFSSSCYSSQCSCSTVVSLGVGVSSFSSTLPHSPSPIKMLFSTLYFPVVLRILFSVVCGSFFRGDHSPGWWKIWSLCLSGQMLLFTLPGSLLVQTCGSALVFLGVFFMLLYSLLALTLLQRWLYLLSFTTLLQYAYPTA